MPQISPINWILVLIILAILILTVTSKLHPIYSNQIKTNNNSTFEKNIEW